MPPKPTHNAAPAPANLIAALPPPDTANYVPLPVVPDAPISEQVFASAQNPLVPEARPDLVGLTWQEGDRISEVTSSTEHRQTSLAPETYHGALYHKATTMVERLMRKHTRVWGIVNHFETVDPFFSGEQGFHNFQPDGQHGPGFYGRTTYHETDQNVQSRTVQSRDRRTGKLISVESFKDNEAIAAHLDTHANGKSNPGETPALAWKEIIPEPVTEVDKIPIVGQPDSNKPGERLPVTLKDIFSQADRLGLESVVGLTWTDKYGQKRTVTQDFVHEELNGFTEHGGSHQERRFTVMVHHQNGDPFWQHDYSVKDLEHSLDVEQKWAKNIKQAPPDIQQKYGVYGTHLHWEVPALAADDPKLILRKAEAARLEAEGHASPRYAQTIGLVGRLALTKVVDPARIRPSGKSTLSPGAADSLLNMPEFTEIKERIAESKARNEEEAKEKAELLIKMVKGVGRKAVRDTAASLMHEYNKARKRLGLEATPDQVSVSWALEALAKRYDLLDKKNPDGSSPQSPGDNLTPGDPFGERYRKGRGDQRLQRAEVALHIHHELVNIHLGEVFASMALVEGAPGQASKLVREDPTDTSPTAKVKVESTIIPQLAVDPKSLTFLPPALRASAKNILSKHQPAEGKHLGPEDYAELGEQLRRLSA